MRSDQIRYINVAIDLGFALYLAINYILLFVFIFVWFENLPSGPYI